MILMIDNYDSFVYNLARYVNELGYETQVVRNDQITIAEIKQLNPDKIIISPGPCDPSTAGISLAVIQSLGATIPILGVCLGHQAIGQAFGGRVVRATRPMHGKSSRIRHAEMGLFKGIANPLTVGRYHSLIVEKHSLPDCLQMTAESEIGEVMALRHRVYPIYGVQFHPESVLTAQGYDVLANFLSIHSNA